VRRVSPEYLRVLRVALPRGPHLTANDLASAPLVALVNDAAAWTCWPGQDAMGQRITVANKERVVVGVVGDIRHLGPETPFRQEAYVSLAQECMKAARPKSTRRNMVNRGRAISVSITCCIVWTLARGSFLSMRQIASRTDVNSCSLAI
jgi:hypothetical protein